MKTRLLLLTLTAVLLCVTAPPPAFAATVDQSFTYQGELNDANGRANGLYDFRFRLFPGPNTLTPVFSSLTITNVTVADGRFTTSLNFSNTFTSTAYWLRVEVRTNSPDNSLSFVQLSPRQPLTAVPYASYATNSDYAVNAGAALSATTADTASSVAPNAITAAGILSGAITANKLATNIAVWTKTSTGIYNNDNLNIGIGTSAPGANLDVRNSGADAVVRINADNSHVSELRLWRSSAQDDGWGIGRGLDESFYVNRVDPGVVTNECLAITTDGNVGIGGRVTTNIASRILTIVGDGAAAQYPGTSGILLQDPLKGASWAMTTFTTGDLHFFKIGGGNNEVVVPILTVLGGSDIAEPFNIHSQLEARPGMVVSIDPEKTGELRVSTRAYDSTVAGIVSGAGGVKTGMTLKQDGTAATGKLPIALTGRVYCYVDADAGGPVAPGDLLTTSDTPGHAMKVTDRARAGGATLGKAMSSLKEGKGLVLVLVTLQ